MQITTNILTEKYEIKLARYNGKGTSLRLGFSGEWVDKEILLIPILDDDLIKIKENPDGTFLINVCALEMFKKVVVPQNKEQKTKGGRAYVPNDYIGCKILIVPIE